MYWCHLVSRQIIFFIVVFFSLFLYCYHEDSIAEDESVSTQVSPNSRRLRLPDSPKGIDAVLLIDNSGSMDWLGHDLEGNRFEGARMFIDKSEEGDNIALIDFSSSSKRIMPLTKVTEARKSTMKSIVSTVRSNRQLTNINSALELALQELSSSRANPAHTPAVILLTDGEIDVVDGTPEEKRLAAKASEEILFSQILPKYIHSYIPIYTISLGKKADTRLLEKVSERSKTRQQANEQHHFSAFSPVELVEIFSLIQSQLKKKPVVAQKYHFTGEPIHHRVETTPMTKEVGVEVLLDHKKDMRVAVTSPNGKVVKPYSQGDKYNLYKVDNPEVGQWNVSVEGKGENEIILATYVDDEIKIDLPFKGRFRLDEPIQIFANILYENNIVEGDVVEVEFSGRKHPFKIKELLLTILPPGGRRKGPFSLKRENGSYAYFYKADTMGEYTFDFTLKGNARNKDIGLLAQKKVFVFQEVEPPTLLFKPLKPNYSPGDTLTLELSVIKSAELMHSSSILVEVNSPQGSDTLSIPREGLKMYSLQYTQTDQEGEYIFTVMKKEDYEVAGYQQSTKILSPSALPWKLLAPILAVGVLIITGLLVIGTKDGWYTRSKYHQEDILPEEVKEPEVQKVEEEISVTEEEIKEPAPEPEEAKEEIPTEKVEEADQEEVSVPEEEIKEPAPELEEAEEEVSTEEVKEPTREETPMPLPAFSERATRPIPDEILVWDKYSIVEYIHLSERIQGDGKKSYDFECFDRQNIILNDNPITDESIIINHGDVVRLGKISFGIDLPVDTPVSAISHSEDVKLEISDKGDLIRWFVLPAVPPPPRVGSSILMFFAQGNLLHIGKDSMINAFEPNDIILFHPSVASRQIVMRKDDTPNYFIRALANETTLNDSVLIHGREEKLSNGDIVKMGVFTFRIELSESVPRSEIIEYRG